MHLHASFLDFLVFLSYLIIAQFFLRMIAYRYPDSPMGKAIITLT